MGRDSSVSRRAAAVQVSQVWADTRSLRVIVCARVDRRRSLHRYLPPNAQSSLDGRQRPPSGRRRMDRRRHLRYSAARHLRLRRAGTARIGRLRLLGAL